MSSPAHNDKAAAFRGLIITAVLLFIMSYAIVQWTNRQFAGHSQAAGAAPKAAH